MGDQGCGILESSIPNSGQIIAGDQSVPTNGERASGKSSKVGVMVTKE